MQNGPTLTTAQAAALLGLHRDTVRRMLKRGVLPGLRLGPRQWRVTRRELDDFKALGGVRPQGRPRKNDGGKP